MLLLTILLALMSTPFASAQRFFFKYNVAARQNRNLTLPTVNLGYATYRGIRVNAGVDQYLGIRYAQAPLGDLRFRAPLDPLPESTPQDASKVSPPPPTHASQHHSLAHTSKFGPLCIGVAQSPPADGSLSEDCLTANVFTPSTATPDSKLPVWLFIQGGGYATLGPFFNGTEVVRASGGEIVFVNFNYRVGALGFLASEALKNDGDLNAGLLDQRRMLEWVQEHIAKVRRRGPRDATENCH